MKINKKDRIRIQQKINAERHKQVIARATENGTIEQCTKHMSAIYLLHCQAAMLFDELDEMLAENGLATGRLGTYTKKLQSATDDYLKVFSKMIGPHQTISWSQDIDEFNELYRTFTGLKTAQKQSNEL